MRFFTVIIPTYNRALLLREALQSLRNQTFSDYEAFIIDDGSSDGTEKVFDEFRDNKNWHFVRFPENKGQAFARNYAMMKSDGRYLTFLDSDDMWFPNRLAEFANLAERNRKAGFIFSNAYIMRNNIILGKIFNEKKRIPRGKLEPYMAISDKWLPYVTTNVAVKREVSEKVGRFREDMHFLEDMEFYVRVLRYYEVDYIKMPLAIYRIHDSAEDLKSLTLNWEKGIEDFHAALKTAHPSEKVSVELRNYVYRKQAVVYIKNLNCSKARKYLRMTTTRDIGYYFCMALTFLPPFFLLSLKKIYNFARSKSSFLHLKNGFLSK